MIFTRTIITLIFGAILFIGWHFFMDLHWHNDASFDIVSGGLIEFFIFTYLLSQFEKREERQRAKEMDAHLYKIEKMLKRIKEQQDKELR